MRTGILFDIKEFAVHDGPGIRTTLFLKGCPLRCAWCHNPEGLSPEPQCLTSPAGERLAGREYRADELAGLLNRQAEVLRAAGGGVTFSGGEPLLQAEFAAEVIERLGDVHVLLDTSGYAGEGEFRRLAERCHLVYFDLKLIDAEEHRAWTGVANEPILSNLERLSAMGIPFVVRVPLVPGVTDTRANLAGIAARVAGLPGLRRVDLLPYNRAAGGKYRACGREFRPGFQEDAPVNADTAPFAAAGVPVRVA